MVAGNSAPIAKLLRIRRLGGTRHWRPWTRFVTGQFRGHRERPTSALRQLSSLRRSSGCSVAVIGGGPAGVCVAATAALSPQVSSVVIFDAKGFNAGMLQLFSKVPGNTKLEALEPFLASGPIGTLAQRYQDVAVSIHGVRANALKTPTALKQSVRSLPARLTATETAQLFDYEQEFDPCRTGWPLLGDMAKVFQSSLGALRNMDHVTAVAAPVRCVQYDQDAGWTVNSSHTVDAVVFCQGGTARTLQDLNLVEASAGVRSVSLEQELDPLALRDAVSLSDRVGVVGNSHTGALVLRNLAALGHPHVQLFGMHPVRLARWSDRVPGYLYTATGLKGVAAAFALEELAKDAHGTGGMFSLQRGPEELEGALRGGELDAVVVAAGFTPRPYPDLRVSGHTWRSREARDILRYDARDGSLSVAGGGVSVTGLYEVGISRPEYHTDSSSGPHPACAFSGGEETQREGWRGEHVVGWTCFAQRAATVVDSIVSAKR